jgi:hypothetical protein
MTATADKDNDDNGSWFARARPPVCKLPKGQREGMEMVEKKRVDYVLLMEQERTGTQLSRTRPYSL